MEPSSEINQLDQTTTMEPSSSQSQSQAKDLVKKKKKKKKSTKIEASLEQQPVEEPSQTEQVQVEKKRKRQDSKQPKSALFERVFSLDDEIYLLTEWAALRDQGIRSYSHLYELVKPKITQAVDCDQVKNKIQKLKNKYIQAEIKLRKSGKEPLFSDPKSLVIYKLSRRIWINDVPCTSDTVAADAKLHVYIESLKGMGLYDLVKGKCLLSLKTQQLVFQLSSFSNQLQEARDLTVKMIASLDH